MCRLVATLCSHSTANFPKNTFYFVVLSPLSGKVFGIWDDIPCPSFAVACLFATRCFFAAGRGAVPPLFLQRWRTPLAITLHTLSANSCELPGTGPRGLKFVGDTCPRVVVVVGGLFGIQQAPGEPQMHLFVQAMMQAEGCLVVPWGGSGSFALRP